MLSDLFFKFPQFKAHIAIYIERNYCGVVTKDRGHRSFDMLECGESRLLRVGSLSEQAKSAAAQMERG